MGVHQLLHTIENTPSCLLELLDLEQQKIPLNSNDLEIILNYVDQDHTNQISFQLFSSRLYLYRISVRDQLRVRAHEFSKHQLDQHRMFIQPTGSKEIDKPPQGESLVVYSIAYDLPERSQTHLPRFPSKELRRQVQSKSQPRSGDANQRLRHRKTNVSRIHSRQRETGNRSGQLSTGNTFQIAYSTNEAYNVSKSKEVTASTDPQSSLQDGCTEDHHSEDQFIPVPILQVYDRSYFEQTGAQ
ncbi:hypothetical protein EG68_05170 [Paragonimus skrjabini miyazakii]|uniref:EF-hand domain-containing protein n=1 Tax=Paragonimus skrjabini miyazakii TaxID=59628 RepID=A0A8S9YTY6_9TREM|nr:hypothetical protein EG68_05170 [Paragonimus skrjabini miyazakii]